MICRTPAAANLEDRSVSAAMLESKCSDAGVHDIDNHDGMLETLEDPIAFEEMLDRMTAAVELKLSLRPKSPTREERISKKQEIERNSLIAALNVYAKKNNIQPTELELVEVTEKNIVAELGKRYGHYNFLVKRSNGPPTLFFAEVLPGCSLEEAVYLCTSLEDHDSGHCFGCNMDAKNLVHPTCGGYLGGHDKYWDSLCKEWDSDDDDYI